MYFKKSISAAILCCCVLNSYSQNRNSVWCFGDSAGIDFNNLSNPQPIHSNEKSRGSCATICDSTGHLLFYSGYNTQGMFGGPPDYNGEVYNNQNHVMQNGDLIISETWYQEQVIIPMPDSSNKYYLFSINVTGGLGLFYSVIDMALDSGRGAVTVKNSQLLNYSVAAAIISVRHGNGRDWWLLSRRSGSSIDEFYEYLVTPYGISGPFIIQSGSSIDGNIYSFSFSNSGTKLLGFNEVGVIDLFDFDRCTGNIILNQTISQAATMAPYPYYFGGEFSSDEHYLYVSQLGVAGQHPTYLKQYDLTAPVISATADTIWSYDSTEQAGGQLRLAPDGKVYLACAYHDGVHFNYPYPDSVFNTVNNNLSVINYPDSPGVACGFVPFSFNLGAGRCYWGLPNNPDYELGAVVNSMCDTVMQVGSMQLAVGNNSRLHVFYHAGWQVAFINAEGLKGMRFYLQVYDLFGRIIFSDEGSLNSEYYTKDLNCDGFAEGMYIVTLQTGPDGSGEKLVKRFIKQ